MATRPKFSFTESESAQSADRSIFDPDPVDEDDLWFLPGADHATLDQPYDLPGPRADHSPLVDVDAWVAAEASLVRPLTDLGIRVGRLTVRLGQGPRGWRHRLALREAVDLSWLAGDRVPMERLALWLTLRLAGDGDDAQALSRAGWAVRRLEGGLPPQDNLAAFLGRGGAGDHAMAVGTPLADRVSDWQEVMAQAQGLHPICQAALGFHLWPVVGLSAGHAMGGAAPIPLMEAAVVAARSALPRDDADGALFLPLALGGAGGLRFGGTPQERLRRWIAGADQATRAALRLLDGLEVWEANAAARCADLSGRTPKALLRLLRDWPLVSAPMAEAETGASRAAVQRNLSLMAERGILHEVTGQGRYRFWRAAA